MARCDLCRGTPERLTAVKVRSKVVGPGLFIHLCDTCLAAAHNAWHVLWNDTVHPSDCSPPGPVPEPSLGPPIPRRSE